MQSTKIKKLNKKFNKYVDRNRIKLIDDFCKEIKDGEIGNLTLDEYSSFRFWQFDQKNSLNKFYAKFQKETKEKSLGFDMFCRWVWIHLDEEGYDFPDNIKMSLDELDSPSMGMAEA